MDQYSQDIVKLITAHPESVQLLYKKYGFRKKPTLFEVLNVYQNYGEPFLREMYAAITKDSDNFLGIGKNKNKTANQGAATLEPTMTEATDKQTGWAKFSDWFNDATNTLTGVTNAINQGTQAANIINQTAVNPPKTTVEPTVDKDKKKGETWLYIGIGSIVLLVLIIILIKMFK